MHHITCDYPNCKKVGAGSINISAERTDPDVEFMEYDGDEIDLCEIHYKEIIRFMHKVSPIVKDDDDCFDVDFVKSIEKSPST